MLQILHFAQQNTFPSTYFRLFSGEYLRDALNYLDEPLHKSGLHPGKARILTLFGYSQRALGAIPAGLGFHQQALECYAGDLPCANLNHLSRTCVAQKIYAEAVLQ